MENVRCLDFRPHAVTNKKYEKRITGPPKDDIARRCWLGFAPLSELRTVSPNNVFSRLLRDKILR